MKNPPSTKTPSTILRIVFYSLIAVAFYTLLHGFFSFSA